LIGRSGEPIGMLSTHAKQPGKPSEKALRLLDLLARQAADILDRARAEEALRLTHAQLVEANYRKDEFLAMLSHELRNPLAPIRNSLIILQRTSDPAQADRAREVIDRQLHHMTRLVDELLDVSRITRGKIQIQRERLDLDDLVRRTVEDHRMGFANAKIELEMLPAPAEVWVNADRTRLAQTLGNLLHNAGKFTPPGGKVTVTVGEDKSRKLALIDVQDTGSGIEPALLPHMFEAFTQGETTIDRNAGGLGLGLSVVKALIELHGGSVSASSEGPGKGAAFTIALPVAPDAVTMVRELHSNQTLTRQRVLIIDDNVDAAESLSLVLELEGHLVQVAHCGLDGLDKVRSSQPDLVICDIGLPDIDGFEVARLMRADTLLDRISIVALTGYAQPQDVAKAKHVGFDEHLAKPVHLEELRRVVGRLSPPA
jgi:signal transduction histidine kinase